MKKEKILRIEEIKKTNSSYGNYTFNIEVLKKGLNGFYKSVIPIYEFSLKEIENRKKEYSLKLKNQKEVKNKKWKL